jgi:ankyrin repeat protein
MKIRSRKRSTLVAVGLLLLLIAAPVGLAWRSGRQAQLNRALLIAINKNDIHATESLLSEGADANAHVALAPLNLWEVLVNTIQHRSSSKFSDPTPLMYALSVASTPSQYRDAMGLFRVSPEPVEMVQLLLQKGASPTGKYSDGSPLLLMAISYRWTRCVRLMLAAGADPNATDKYGLPIMRAALLLKDTDTVQALIENHANVNWRDTAGRTAIQYAKELHDDKMLLLLKKSGAR